MKLFQACSVSALAVLAASCAEVMVLHSPMHPTATQKVTYTATAKAPLANFKISSIDIYQNVTSLRPCSRFELCGDTIAGWAVPVHTCAFDPPLADATCSVTLGPYPDKSYVGYRAVAHVWQNTSEDGWIYFAAGEYPTTNGLIPIYARADPDQAVDLVFIPDLDYGFQKGTFVTSVTRLVGDALFADQASSRELRNRRHQWNLYVSYLPGDAHEVTDPATGAVSSVLDAPSNWAALSAIADVGVLVHNSALRERSGWPPGAMFSAEDTTTEDWTLPHEIGHGVFALSDEYCCDGGQNFGITTHANMFKTNADCQTSATAHGLATGACTALSVLDCGGAGTPSLATAIHRLDPFNDLMGCGRATTAAFGDLDFARIVWVHDNLP